MNLLFTRFVFLNQVGDLGYFFGCFVNFIPYMYSLAFKVDDKSIITGMLYCIDIFIILEIYKPGLTTGQMEEVQMYFLIYLSLQTNELYQLASVAFCLLVAWVGIYFLFLCEFDFMHAKVTYFEMS